MGVSCIINLINLRCMGENIEPCGTLIIDILVFCGRICAVILRVSMTPRWSVSQPFIEEASVRHVCDYPSQPEKNLQFCFRFLL